MEMKKRINTISLVPNRMFLYCFLQISFFAICLFSLLILGGCNDNKSESKNSLNKIYDSTILTAKKNIVKNDNAFNRVDSSQFFTNDNYDWTGIYSFYEGIPEQNIWIEYNLDIRKKDKEYLSLLSANGFQTSLRIECKTVVFKNKITLYLRKSLDDLILPKLDTINPLFILERSNKRIKTNWMQIEPQIDTLNRKNKSFKKK